MKFFIINSFRTMVYVAYIAIINKSEGTSHCPNVDEEPLSLFLSIIALFV